MATPMTPDDITAFLRDNPRPAYVATTRADGRPHVAPVWYVMDGEQVVFTTDRDSVKGRNLLRTGIATVTVDDPEPPFSFVVLEGQAEAKEDRAAVLRWATTIAAKYLGDDRAEAVGKRSDVPGELIVRITPVRATGMRALTA